MHELGIMRSFVQLTPKQLRSAAAIREKILKLEKQLQQLLGGSAASNDTAPEAPAKKRSLSAAGKARIRKAQKERWARFRAAKKVKG